MIWNFWLWKCAQFLSAPFIILTMAWYRKKKVIYTTGYDLMPNSQKKSWIISLVFSQDPSVWCWVFGGGLGPGGFKFRILISLVSVCFWKFKKVGNSKFWICKGFFNGSGLKNIALHENGVFSVLIKSTVMRKSAKAFNISGWLLFSLIAKSKVPIHTSYLPH